MDDTISRLAVIQIIEKMRARIGHNLERAVGGAMIEILDEVGEDVGKLPPAKLGTNLAQVGTDCISRQSAIDAFNTNLNELVVGGEENAKTVENYLNRVLDKIKCLPSHGDWNLETMNDMVDRVKQLPPIQPAQPKRGKWVLVCDNNGMHFVCDKCGAWRYYQKQNFCGECGTDMRGEKDG